MAERAAAPCVPSLPQTQPSMILRMRVASAFIANGLVIIAIPGSRNPDASAAFSA